MSSVQVFAQDASDQQRHLSVRRGGRHGGRHEAQLRPQSPHGQRQEEHRCHVHQTLALAELPC